MNKLIALCVIATFCCASYGARKASSGIAPSGKNIKNDVVNKVYAQRKAQLEEQLMDFILTGNLFAARQIMGEGAQLSVENLVSLLEMGFAQSLVELNIIDKEYIKQRAPEPSAADVKHSAARAHTVAR